MRAIGRWNTAWGPEPAWQGPARPAPPKVKCRPHKITCTCTDEEYVVYTPVNGDPYICARCGAEMTVTRLVHNRAGHAPRSVAEGDRYGRLVIMQLTSNDHGLRAQCRCDCGNEKAVWVKHLRSGSTSSCGCLKRERSAQHPWRRSWK